MVNIAPKFWGFNDVIVSSNHAIRLMLIIGRSGFFSLSLQGDNVTWSLEGHYGAL
jgi:hypothetical protein